MEKKNKTFRGASKAQNMSAKSAILIIRGERIFVVRKGTRT